MRYRCIFCQTVQVILYTLPSVCPKCRAAVRVVDWRRCDDEPMTEYDVTHNDARFLHSLKIDPDS